MSFLPAPPEQTFHVSDRAALASDWVKVQADMNRACDTIMAAERNRDEQR
jgi:hypothetical protein